MLATDALRTEHRLIERVLDALEVAATRLGASHDHYHAIVEELEIIFGQGGTTHAHHA